jgi:hypothetical protein
MGYGYPGVAPAGTAMQGRGYSAPAVAGVAADFAVLFKQQANVGATQLAAGGATAGAKGACMHCGVCSLSVAAGSGAALLPGGVCRVRGRDSAVAPAGFAHGACCGQAARARVTAPCTALSARWLGGSVVGVFLRRLVRVRAVDSAARWLGHWQAACDLRLISTLHCPPATCLRHHLRALLSSVRQSCPGTDRH